MKRIKLYHYWRSSSSWRIRAMLQYKNISAELIAVNLLNGESESPEHLHRNPAGFVPVLELESGETLAESMAIAHWLELTYLDNPLLPSNPWLQAQVIRLCEIINAGTQPLQNIPVMQAVSSQPEIQKKWNQMWIRKGLETFEQTLDQLHSRDFCVGGALTLAECFLIPQLYNARRFDVQIQDLTRINRIEKQVSALPCFIESHPDRYQPKK